MTSKLVQHWLPEDWDPIPVMHPCSRRHARARLLEAGLHAPAELVGRLVADMDDAAVDVLDDYIAAALEADEAHERGASNPAGAVRREPIRIQLRRTKGWRKPAGTVVVSRPSRWGNPFTVVAQRRQGTAPRWGVFDSVRLLSLWDSKRLAAADAVDHYRQAMLEHRPGTPSLHDVRHELRGRDLACWCPLVDERGAAVPCHADVLLDLARANE